MKGNEKAESYLPIQVLGSIQLVSWPWQTLEFDVVFFHGKTRGVNIFII